MAKKLNVTQTSICNFVEEERLRIDEGMGTDEAFEHVVAQQILTQYLLDDDDIDRGLTDGGGDGGFDGIFIFINDVLVNGEDPGSLHLANRSHIDIHFIQSKKQTGFSESIVQNWKDSFPNLLEAKRPDRKRYNKAIIEHFGLIRALLEQSISKKLQVSINFWAASLALEVHDNLKKQANEFKSRVESIVPSGNNVRVQIEFVTAQMLYKLIEESPDEILTLNGTKEPLCPDDSSAILTVSLSDYYSFITDEDGNLRKSLFESNIRDYQGKVHVNQAIRKTLEAKTSVDFWWLNNGITIIADAVARDMGYGISLTNPRIVNGLQTSNEIAQYCQFSGEGDNRKVLIKCIASSDYETKAKIIQATNNQTSIPPAYLHSLEPIHLQIERYFKNHGLHYDRRKSSGKNSGIPSKDIISISFLGQCLISSLLKQPDYARARPAQILEDEKKYEKIFNEQIPLEAYLNLAKTSVCIKQLIRNCGLTRGEQNDLLFHTIYLYCSKYVASLTLRPSDLELLKPPSLDVFNEVIELVKMVYRECGGDAQTAKSSAFVAQLQERAKAVWDL